MITCADLRCRESELSTRVLALLCCLSVGCTTAESVSDAGPGTPCWIAEGTEHRAVAVDDCTSNDSCPTGTQCAPAASDCRESTCAPHPLDDCAGPPLETPTECRPSRYLPSLSQSDGARLRLHREGSVFSYTIPPSATIARCMLLLCPEFERRCVWFEETTEPPLGTFDINRSQQNRYLSDRCPRQGRCLSQRPVLDELGVICVLYDHAGAIATSGFHPIQDEGLVESLADQLDFQCARGIDGLDCVLDATGSPRTFGTCFEGRCRSRCVRHTECRGEFLAAGLDVPADLECVRFETQYAGVCSDSPP